MLRTLSRRLRLSADDLEVEAERHPPHVLDVEAKALVERHRLRPLICHRPVMPGVTSSRSVCQTSYVSAANDVGRGPTNDISPRRTFQSWGARRGSSCGRNFPDPRDPRVVDDLEVRRRQDVQVLERRLELLRVSHHRSELEHPEPPAVAPGSELGEHHRPWRLDADRERAQREDRDDQREQRDASTTSNAVFAST